MSGRQARSDGDVVVPEPEWHERVVELSRLSALAAAVVRDLGSPAERLALVRVGHSVAAADGLVDFDATIGSRDALAEGIRRITPSARQQADLIWLATVETREASAELDDGGDRLATALVRDRRARASYGKDQSIKGKHLPPRRDAAH